MISAEIIIAFVVLISPLRLLLQVCIYIEAILCTHILG